MILGGIHWASGLELTDYARTNNYSGEIALFGAMEMKKSWQNVVILNDFILSRHLLCLDCWTWFRKLKRTPQVVLISLDVKSLISCFLLLMDWLLLGVKGLELLYHNQQKIIRQL